MLAEGLSPTSALDSFGDLNNHRTRPEIAKKGSDQNSSIQAKSSPLPTANLSQMTNMRKVDGYGPQSAQQPDNDRVEYRNSQVALDLLHQRSCAQIGAENQDRLRM